MATLTSEETIKLYLTLNKLMYKHAEATRVFYIKNRNPDVDSSAFIEILELSLAIDMLLESSDPLVKGGIDEVYPNYLNIEGVKLDKFLDYLISSFKLDPIPYINFPKNSVNYINTGDTVNVNGASLPDGGGVGYFLTKDVNGTVIWQQVTFVSDFNEL